MNVLFRQDASVKYKPVGAQGRRFFGADGAQAIPNGGLVYLGFMQYVTPLVAIVLSYLPLDRR
jgi:eukaryotic translation initiation factor 2C